MANRAAVITPPLMLKRLPHAAAAALALASPLTAQRQFPPAPAPVDPAVAKLRDAALNDTLAYDIVAGLTTEVGQRLAATEAEARARTWAVARLKALGFRNVHVETYKMPVWLQRRVRDAADMPELADDAAAARVHRVRHQPPAGHLRVAPDARREGVALALLGDVGGFGDDQAGGGALRVVGGVQRSRHIALADAAARERRHDDAVRQGQRAHAGGLEQFGGEYSVRHGGKPVFRVATQHGAFGSRLGCAFAHVRHAPP